MFRSIRTESGWNNVTSKKAILAAIFVGLVVSIVNAMGRKPDDEEKDSFPDYNRMEMHTKPANPQPPPPSEPEKPAAPPPMPSLNTPVNAASDVDAAPHAPPPAVPLPAESSEPPMPDDLIGTPALSTATQK
jgi:hypothetical protein